MQTCFVRHKIVSAPQPAPQSNEVEAWFCRFDAAKSDERLYESLYKDLNAFRDWGNFAYRMVKRGFPLTGAVDRAVAGWSAVSDKGKRLKFEQQELLVEFAYPSPHTVSVTDRKMIAYHAMRAAILDNNGTAVASAIVDEGAYDPRAVVKGSPVFASAAYEYRANAFEVLARHGALERVNDDDGLRQALIDDAVKAPKILKVIKEFGVKLNNPGIDWLELANTEKGRQCFLMLEGYKVIPQEADVVGFARKCQWRLADGGLTGEATQFLLGRVPKWKLFGTRLG